MEDSDYLIFSGVKTDVLKDENKDPDTMTNDELGDDDSKLNSEGGNNNGGKAEHPTFLTVTPIRATRSCVGRPDQ